MPPEILVTGGSGFLGREAVARLLDDGAGVRTLTRAGAATSGVTAFAGGLTGPHLGDAVRGVDAVIHLAWSTTPATAAADPGANVMENVVGSLALADAAAAAGVQHVTFVSSGGTVYGETGHAPVNEDHPCRPVSHYGASKLATEILMRQALAVGDVPLATLRVSNPYGSSQDGHGGQGVIGAFARAIQAGDPITLFGDGSDIRDFLHVADAAAAMVLANRTRAEGTWNIGSGDGRSIREVLASIERLLGRPADVTHAPRRPFDVHANVLDASRAAADLGWEPTVPFDVGLRDATQPTTP